MKNIKTIDKQAQAMAELTRRLGQAEHQLQRASGLGGVAVTVLCDPRNNSIIGVASTPQITPGDMVALLRGAADVVQAESVRADERARVQQEAEAKAA